MHEDYDDLTIQCLGLLLLLVAQQIRMASSVIKDPRYAWDASQIGRPACAAISPLSPHSSSLCRYEKAASKRIGPVSALIRGGHARQLDEGTAKASASGSSIGKMASIGNFSADALGILVYISTAIVFIATLSIVFSNYPYAARSSGAILRAIVLRPFLVIQVRAERAGQHADYRLARAEPARPALPDRAAPLLLRLGAEMGVGARRGSLGDFAGVAVPRRCEGDPRLALPGGLLRPPSHAGLQRNLGRSLRIQRRSVMVRYYCAILRNSAHLF